MIPHLEVSNINTGCFASTLRRSKLRHTERAQVQSGFVRAAISQLQPLKTIAETAHPSRPLALCGSDLHRTWDNRLPIDLVQSPPRNLSHLQTLSSAHGYPETIQSLCTFH